MRAQVLVATRAPDAVAQSAAIALGERLGFGTTLERLQRRLYLELTFGGGQAGGRELLTRLLERTTLIANPNKERTEAFIEPDAMPLAEGVGILVWDREGARGAALEARIRARVEGASAVGVRWATLWLPRFRSATESDTLLAERITSADRRGGGLLANPNAERWALFEGHLPHGVLADPDR